MTKHPHAQIRWDHALPVHAVPAHVAYRAERRRWLLAAFLAAGLLVGFLALAYLALPDELPVWTQRLLGLTNAVLAVIFFILATHRSHHLGISPASLRRKKGNHPDFGKHPPEHRAQHQPRTVTLPFLGETSMRAVSGMGVFLAVLLWWLTPWAPVAVHAQEMENLSACLGAEIETVVLMLADAQLAVPHAPVRPAIAASMADRIPIDGGLFLLGQKATAQGRYDDARPLLLAALSSTSDEADKIHLAMAQNELYAGNCADAAEQYDKVLRAKPASPRLWAQAAVAWLHAGNYARAEELASTAVTMAARSVESNESFRWTDQMVCEHVQAAVFVCRGKEFQKAEDSNKQVQDVWRNLYGEGTAYAISLNNQAVLFQLLGKYPGAQNNQHFANSIWLKSLGVRHPYMAASRSNLAMLLYAQGRYRDAQRTADQVAQLRSEILPPTHTAQATGLNISALVDLANGRYSNGLFKARRALEILEERLSPQHPHVAAVLRSLGALYQGLARHRRAEYYFYRMGEISQATLGDAHPYVASSLSSLASLYLVEERYNEAQQHAEPALKIDERVLGKDHPAVARNLCMLAQVMIRTHQPEKARPLLERALRIQKIALLEEHPDIAMTQASLAAVDRETANYETAVGFYEQAIKIDREFLGQSHPTVARFLCELAALHLAHGEYDQAETQVKECIEICRASLAPYHPQLADALELYAEILHKHDPEAKERIEELTSQAAKIRSDHADINAGDSRALENTGA